MKGDKEMEKPNYYGILPANVRYDKNLKPMAKILYTEITALSNKNGYCNATNSYFANLYEVSKNTVSLWISDLEKAGYIKTDLIYEIGTKNIKERRIYINDTPITKNDEDNNTSNNNTSLILKEKINKKEKSQTEVLTDYVDGLNLDTEKKEIFKKWIIYKKDNKQYKNTISIDSLIKKWGCYSSMELEKIVENSISNGYQGLFELKKGFTKSEEKRINHQTTGAVKTKPDSWWEEL